VPNVYLVVYLVICVSIILVGFWKAAGTSIDAVGYWTDGKTMPESLVVFTPYLFYAIVWPAIICLVVTVAPFVGFWWLLRFIRGTHKSNKKRKKL
jgi:hypothetical protein